MENLGRRLTKTLFLHGLQCPKMLYLSVHRPELARDLSRRETEVMEKGIEVGLEARKRFPQGILIEAKGRDEAVVETRRAMANGAAVLFEAAFERQGAFARLDILSRSADSQGWTLYEVKSSTAMRDSHAADAAFQAWTARGAGLPLGRVNLMRVNKECRHPDLDAFFLIQDITAAVELLQAQVENQVAQFLRILNESEPPEVDIGPHCTEPYECPFRSHCWKHVPSPSVFQLPRIGGKAWDYYRNGILALDDARLTDLPPRLENIRQSVLTGRRWVDRERLKDLVSGWTWPAYFLDFETIASTVPVFQGARPGQNVPFQFSVLAQEEEGGETQEVCYLHGDAADPRPAVAERLVQAVGPEGPIFAYHAKFEAACLETLAEACPEHAASLRAMAARLADPLPVLRETVYDPAFEGSYGLKKVAPALLGTEAGYGGLSVSDGGQAPVAYRGMIGPSTTADRRAELRAALLAYCGQDTRVLAELVQWLRREAGLAKAQ
jgi:hypothetical protein